MLTRSAAMGMTGAALTVLLAVTVTFPPTSARETLRPGPTDRSEAARRDLVVVDISATDAVRANGLTFTWLGASFLLAEWTEAEQSIALEASVPFEILHRDAGSLTGLRLVELDAGVEPPESWKTSVLFHAGGKWVMEMTPDEATGWATRGDHSLQIPRESRQLPAPSPLIAYDCSLDPLIDDLLAQATSTRWMDWISKISGNETVTIDGDEYSILTRYSTPMFAGDPLAKGFDFLLQQADSWHYGPSKVEVDEYDVGSETWKNLILTIPGQIHPDEIVLMTGHFDSVSPSASTNAPGADDNGSGSATLLEAARLFRQLRFDRTIRIVWFSGEEDGLLGSEAYLADHPSDDFLGAVNLDMMGYDGDGDRCFEIHAGTLPQSIDVADCFAASLTSYGINMPHDFLTSGATDRSDHASFWQEGVGAVEIAENFFNNNLPGGCSGSDQNPNYHTTSDTIDNVSASFGSDIARTGLATVAAMAIPVEACFSDAPQVTATPGIANVELQWTPIAGAATYRVYRSDRGCEGQWFEVVETAGTSWIDMQAHEPMRYYYQVEAVDADGFCISAASNCAEAVPTVYHASGQESAPIDVCAGGGPGSGDGIVDPGESVLLPVSLLNDGNAQVTEISGTMFTLAPGVSILDPSASWPDIDPDTSAQSLPNHFGFQVEDTVACGTTVTAGLNLVYAQGANATNLPILIGDADPTLILDEDFSTGIPPGWTVVDGGSGGGAAATWTTSNPGGRSIDPPFDAPFAIVDSDEAGSSSSQDEQLLSPVLDASLCDEVTLEFSNQFRWYNSSQSEKADVDVSTDGGQNWTNVLRIEGGSDGYPDPNVKSVDLTGAIASNPSQVTLRFHYHDADYEWWWAIDNVQVRCDREVCTPCGTSVSPPGEPGESPQLVLGMDAGDVVLDWDNPGPGCGTVDYAVYRGDLSTLRTVGYDHGTVLTCTAGATTFGVPLTDPELGTADYFLVVADNGVQEGSYGRDSSAVERPSSSAACHAAQNLLSCGP